jgi:hypothetical protein
MRRPLQRAAARRRTKHLTTNQIVAWLEARLDHRSPAPAQHQAGAGGPPKGGSPGASAPNWMTGSACR